ncbi:MAG: bifunctional (p)ppGpp synthetase/guanosine-3',5'-bis(diphosphate) 3'-pyrophosphohydrolase [Bacteroidales bacterium]|nr:bifunctional (p)ppGpp synthetase/guanosine-3',5'-bis(diphosphate) 3'-pyrophosphohydrolase [Clostridium sp.]MCM1203436.1 bifunctional (p)ppGpp synthetase/guanosine-3',5'-bis(diphosphate) 3'-pyrophosphohydrolase [Bacteroidales bacterium]
MAGMINKDRELSTPKDFTPPEELYQTLIEKVLEYHPNTDITMIEKAYAIANKAHEGQLRKSGEPYIMHPLCVAIILAELELDKETIVAGILHDVIEDTVMTNEEIEKEFSAEILLLVDGVTKLTQLNFSQDKLELQAENLRKMFLAMAKDIRVILIKLADRLHNLRTLQYQTPAKQIEKARETMDIYSPIAHRLGISKIKVELDDLSLQYLEPEKFKELKAGIDERLEERETFIQNIVHDVKECISKADIKAEISGRVKHFFSIYKKMVNQNKTLDQIYDIFAVRIIVDSVKDCYAALGIIHEEYTPIPGRFKDYIAMPKSNKYQSLHTTLLSKSGQPFEIQIRTYDMHKTAEYGIAAHWKYKENLSGTTRDKEEEKLSWLRQILEWQRDTEDNREFMSAVKTDLDLFTEQVYCFTPNGDVKNLPAGSNPIDFAYSIHSAVGNKMVGARVNGRQVPVSYTLQNGDRVEIVTSQNSKGPSRDWLSIVKSAQAKNKINQWFKQEFKEDNISRGKELLLSYCKAKGYNYSDYTKPAMQQAVLTKYNFRDWDSVLAAIGHGALKEGQVMNKLIETRAKEEKTNLTEEDLLEQLNHSGEIRRDTKYKGGITVNGIDDVAVHFSRCCSPVPGDEIVGYVTRGRGISIHRTDCVNIVGMSDIDRSRLLDAEWRADAEESAAATYSSELRIYAADRTGMLFDISKVFTEANINVTAVNSRSNSKKEHATITVAFDIRTVDQLRQVIAKLHMVPGVIDVERSVG